MLILLVLTKSLKNDFASFFINHIFKKIIKYT